MHYTSCIYDLIHTWFIYIYIIGIDGYRYFIVALYIRVVYTVCVSGCMLRPQCKHMICKNDGIAILPLHAGVVQIWCVRLSTSLIICFRLYTWKKTYSFFVKTWAFHKKNRIHSFSLLSKTPNHWTLNKLTTQLLPGVFFPMRSSLVASSAVRATKGLSEVIMSCESWRRDDQLLGPWGWETSNLKNDRKPYFMGPYKHPTDLGWWEYPLLYYMEIMRV